MVEMQLRRIRHKNPGSEEYCDTRCGLFDYGGTFEIRKSWRWVTCKRCLRSKPKKS